MSRIGGWTRTLAQWQQNATAKASTDEAFAADMTEMAQLEERIKSAIGARCDEARWGGQVVITLWPPLGMYPPGETNIDTYLWVLRNMREDDPAGELLAAWRDENAGAAA